MVDNSKRTGADTAEAGGWRRPLILSRHQRPWKEHEDWSTNQATLQHFQPVLTEIGVTIRDEPRHTETR